MTRTTALLLTVLTGFSGLVYEVAWQKYLATLLGSHSEATAAVLAIYLGGLAAGYSVFGRLTGRVVRRARAAGKPPRLLLLYGFVEAGIGVYAMLFPLLFGAAQRLSLMLPHWSEASAFSIDVFLTVLLIAPPTVLMGGTIPVLTQTLSDSVEESTRVHARVYAFNTAGAFFGALAGAFLLIPLLGLDGVVRAMGIINLLAGATFVILQRTRVPLVAAPPGEVGDEARATNQFLGYAVVALLAGFAMMSIQTVLNRIGALSFGASHFTFAMVVAVFVLCIALGSFFVSTLRHIPPTLIVASQWLLVALLGLLYFEIENAPYYAHVIRAVFGNIPEAFYPYYFLAFTGILAVLIVPIGLSGALLPLIFHHLRDEIGDLGSIAGRLYGWNTLGSLLGALLGGYALLFWIDLHDVFAVSLAALTLGAGLLTALVLRPPFAIPAIVTAAALSLILALPAWQPERLSSGLFRNREPVQNSFAGPDAMFAMRKQGEVIFHDDDPTSTVNVFEGGGPLGRAIVTNGKPDGHLRVDYPTMALAGLVPALFTDDLSRVFVIGYGTGVTAGELAALDESEEVVVAEISPAVLEASPLFDPGNQRASVNPKLKTLRSDAYRALLRSQGQYGVIASEPSNPWVTGVEMLFSEEFLRAARSRLTPGGIYVQWFHLYEVDQATVELVLRTYNRVFERVAVWSTRGPDILLLGFNDPGAEIDVEELRTRFERPDLRAGLERAKIESWEALLTHELLPLDTLAAAKLEGPVHTLRHPVLSDQAARAFFAGTAADLPRLANARSSSVGARNSVMRIELGDPRTPISEERIRRLATHACKMSQPIGCLVFLARWQAEHPASEGWEEILEIADSRPESKLSRKTVSWLTQMFRGEPATGPRGGGLADARRTTDLYSRFYHHGMPFDRAVVALAWKRCSRSSPVISCTEGRHKAEARLGSFAAQHTAR